MKNLVGLSKKEIQEELEALGEKSFRAKQLWNWIYVKGETSFSNMSNLSKDFRKTLEKNFIVKRPEVINEQTSTDGTRKWLLRFDDGSEVETVYIPEDDRGAVCVSTQVGCSMGCKFCHTGTQGLVRNLTAGEIISQFMVAKDSYNEWVLQSGESRKLSNIVVMGMGEPLNNYENTVKALDIVTDGDGLAISRRKITLSTCGIVPKIKKAAKDINVKLALSLHASNDETRSKIMPINKKYSIKEVLQSCREYQNIAQRNQYITIEYVMLKGINDSIKDAKELVNLVKGMKVKFNLIPFNGWEGCEFESSSFETIKKFAQFLENANHPAPIRSSRGQDILAACGQLKSETNRCRRDRR